MDIIISLISATIVGVIFVIIDGIGVDFGEYYNGNQSDKRKGK
jgi:hypothetical protein